MPTFATAIERDSNETMKWCGSSAWLEYMPVTHGVAGSSPVRTACKALISKEIKAFFIPNVFFTPLWENINPIKKSDATIRLSGKPKQQSTAWDSNEVLHEGLTKCFVRG